MIILRLGKGFARGDCFRSIRFAVKMLGSVKMRRLLSGTVTGPSHFGGLDERIGQPAIVVHILYQT